MHDNTRNATLVARTKNSFYCHAFIHVKLDFITDASVNMDTSGIVSFFCILLMKQAFLKIKPPRKLGF